MSVTSCLCVAWLAAVAHGSDAALEVERARALMRAERAPEARLHALQALEHQPGLDAAWRVYLRSSVLAGWGAVAEAELAARAETDPNAEVSWTWWQIRQGRAEPEALESLRLAGAEEAAIARAWVAWTWQGDPTAVQWLPEDASNPMAQRLRLRMLAEQGPEKALRREAKAWSRGHPDHPDVLTEVWDVADGSGLGAIRRRLLGQAMRQVQAEDTSSLLLYRTARLLAAAREKDAALEVGARLVERGLEPPLPRRGWGEAMQEGMGRVLAMNRDSTLPLGTPGELLRITEVRAERLLVSGDSDAAVAAFEALRAVSDSTDAALVHADLLLELDRAEAALQAARQAARLAAGPEADDVARLDTARQAVQLARALGVQAEAWMALGEPAHAMVPAALARDLDPQARWWALWARVQASPGLERAAVDPLAREVTATVEVLLSPQDASAWQQRAEVARELGHAELAFASEAMVRHLTGESIGATDGYRGPSTAGIAAEALVAVLSDSLQTHAAKVAEWVAEHGARSPVMPEVASGLVLGRSVPAWQIKGRDGAPIDADTLAGRPYVMTVWASWCGPCKLELPELNQAAARDESPWFAVSVDAHEAAFIRAARRGNWDALMLGWNPELSATLGVDRIPTTFVADRDGRVVHIERGYSPSGVQRIRAAMAEQSVP